MQLLYGEGFNEAERDFRRHVVHENLIRGFQNLFEEMEERQPTLKIRLSWCADVVVLGVILPTHLNCS